MSGRFGDYRDAQFAMLVGRTIASIDGATAGRDEVFITCEDGDRFRMVHDQECCESVTVEEVVGDVADLIGSPILHAEEVTNSDGDQPAHVDDSWTWTFYKLATIKGSVTIRWLGSSNGYYSESVDFLWSPKVAQGRPMTPDEKIIAAYRALVARATWIAGQFKAVDLSDRPEVAIVGDDARLEWRELDDEGLWDHPAFHFPARLLSITEAEAQAWIDQTTAEQAHARAETERKWRETREAADRAALAQLKHKYEGGPDPRHTAAQPAPGVLSMPWPPAWPLHPPSMQPGHFSAAPPHFTQTGDDT